MSDEPSSEDQDWEDAEDEIGGEGDYTPNVDDVDALIDDDEETQDAGGAPAGEENTVEELLHNALKNDYDDAVFNALMDDDDDEDSSKDESYHRVTESQLEQRLKALDADSEPDLGEDALQPPVHWPSVSPAEIEPRLRALYGWVEQLRQRFAVLDMQAIPPCWWMHTEHVELLQALWDHERISFFENSSPAAAMGWQRELEWAERRLQQLTKFSGCGREHKPISHVDYQPDGQQWEAHITRERERHT